MADIFDLAKGKDTGKANSKPAQNTKQDIFSLASNIPKPEEKSYTMPAAEQPTAARPAAKGSLFSKWLAAIGEMGDNVDPYAGYATDPFSYEQIYGNNKTTERTPAVGRLADSWQNAIYTNPRTSVSTASQFMGGGEPIQFEEPARNVKPGRTLDQVRAQNVEETWKPGAERAKRISAEPRETVAERRAAITEEGASPYSFQQRMAMQGYEEKQGDLVGQSTSGREAAIEAARPFNAAQKPTQPEDVDDLWAEFNELSQKFMDMGDGKIVGVEDYTPEEMDRYRELSGILQGGNLGESGEQSESFGKKIWRALTDKILGIDENAVTGEKTDWKKLFKGMGVKGANQTNAAMWNGVDFLFGDAAQQVHALGVETINSILDIVNLVPGVDIGYLGEGTNAITSLADDARLGLNQALETYQANANSSRAAQVVDKFGTSFVAALPMALEAMFLGYVPQIDAAARGLHLASPVLSSANTAGLTYFSGLQSATGMEQIGMMAGAGHAQMLQNPMFWTSYLQAVGDSFENVQGEEGMSDMDKGLYALVNAYFNAMIEIGGADEALGGIQNLPMRLQDALESGNKYAVVDWFKDSVLGEGWEEVQQGAFERGFKAPSTGAPMFSLDPNDENAVINPYTAADEFFGGAVVGGLLGGGEVALGRAVESARNAAQRRAETEQALQEGAQTEEQQEAPRPTREARPEIEEEGRAEAQESRPEPHREARPEIEEEGRTEAPEKQPEPRTTVEEQRAESVADEAAQDVAEEATEEKPATKGTPRPRAAAQETTDEAPAQKTTVQVKAENRKAVMESIIEREAGRTGTEISASEKSALADAFNIEDGVKGSTYAAAVVEAYSLGKEGNVSLEEARHGSRNGERISASQFQRAFELGRGETASGRTVAVRTKAQSDSLRASLASLGQYAGDAAKAYENGQDIGEYAAAMSEAAERYAVTGADIRAQGGVPADSVISALTDAQIEKAQEIGGRLRAQRAAAISQLAEQRRAIRAQARAIEQQNAADADALTEVNRQIREANKIGKDTVALFEAQREALIKAVEADPNFQDTEEYAKAFDEAKANMEKAQDLQRAVEDLNAKKKALEAKKPTARKKGTVNLDGGNIAGTEYKGIDRGKLTRQQQNIVAMVERLADIINIDYVVFDGPANMGGAYMQGGRIFININAGMTKAGRKSIAAASLSHELTHFMQEYAPEEYQQLKDYVIGTILNKSQTEFDRMIRQQRRWEPGKSYDELADELVANACQTMLTDDKAVQRMARSNMTLAQKVADVLDEIGEKIRKAFDGLSFDEDRAIFAPVKAVMDEIDGITERWADGISAAVENYNAEQTVKNSVPVEEVLQDGKPKFQMTEDVEATDQLVAVHNKSVSGLRRMLQRGGVPFPSIAIKKAGSSHEGFGEVSIVFPRSTIDPAASRWNRLYSNDAWTPTEPRTEYDVGDTWKIQQQMEQEIGTEIYRATKLGSYLEKNQLERDLSTSEGDVVKALKGRAGIKYAYLKSIGQEPKVAQREKPLDGFGRYENAQLLAVFDSIPASELKEMDYDSTETLQKVADALNQQWLSSLPTETAQRLAGKWLLYSADKINPQIIKDALRNYENNGRAMESEVDDTDLERQLRDNKALEDDPKYQAWIRERFNGLIKDSGIPNGKGVYTDTGSRRSFKARHVPATLENIVQQMRKEQEKGIGLGGINLRGAATKAYRSVEEMRAESGKLLGARIFDEEYDSYMKEFGQRLNDLTETADKVGYDTAKQTLLEAVRDSKSKPDMQRRLQNESRWINYSEELADDLWQLRNDVQNMPAPYFEAKPRRVVSPDEALAYIIPDNAGSDIVNDLESRGYNVMTYKAGNEQDRLAKLNSVEGAQFQRFDDASDDTASESRGRDIAYARLQSENAILTETVAAMKKLTGKQGKTIAALQKRLQVTTTPEVRQSDARKLTRQLIRENGSKADAERVSEQLKALGDYILQTDTAKLDENEMKNRARAIASEILNSATEQINVEDDTFQRIAGEIKGRKLSIDEDFLGELDQAGGYDTFRKSVFGNFTLAKRESASREARDGYMTVDQFYTDMQGQYGKGLFPDAANEGEQVQILARMLDAAKPMEVNPFEQYMGEATEELANRIVMDAMNGVLRQTAPTTADRQKARTQALKEQIDQLKAEQKLDQREAASLYHTVYDLTVALDKATSKYQTLRTEADYRAAQLRAEGTARAAEIKAAERARAADKIAQLKEHYREIQQNAKERRTESAGVTKYRKQVEKKAKKLYEMLMTNSNDMHVPEVLKAPLGEFLESLDFTSKRSLAGGEETRADEKFGSRLVRLQQMLANQQSYINGDGNIEQDLGGYIDVAQPILDHLRTMAELITQAMSTGRTFTVNQMTAQDLKTLSEFMSNLRTAINNMNRFMANARYESVQSAARADIEHMKALGKASEISASAAVRFAGWENGTPYYILKRFGAGAKSIFDGFAKGWERLAFNAQEIIDFTEKLYTDKEVRDWKRTTHDITLEDGSKIKMTTAQIMELSMLLGREQAVKHISRGGIRIGDIETKKGKIHDTAHYHLSDTDIKTITGTLTERQSEVAKAMQRFMADRGAEWGNEVSMRRFGYKFYEEGPGYYPIKTDSNDRPMADTDAQTNSMFRLLNLSASKSLNPKASNALVVGDIFDTFADHMSDMAKLNGMGLPILDAIKWFNYKERVNHEDGTYDTVTLQGAMEEAFGEQAQRYFRTLMKDINGVNESGDRGTSLPTKLMSNYKIASVAANLRVAFLQPTSYIRATTVLKPKYMAGIIPSKAAYREAMKYSGTAVWKSLGYYETDISKSMRGQITHDDSFRDKVADKSMALAELGDQATWSMLWQACKKQAKAESPSLSQEALMEKTAEMFREVVYSSQVMDSTLTRSEIMRGKTGWTKAMSAFMAEPTLSYNILMDAASEYDLDVRKNGKAGAWKRNSGKIGKAFTVYVASAAFAAVVESIADAVRDDDDEEFWEKFRQALWGEKGPFSGNLVQDLTILGKLPYVKNFISTLQGYTSGDMSVAAFNNLVNVYKIWEETIKLQTGALDKATKVTSYGKMTEWGKVYKTLQALSQLSGFAVSNLTRDVTAIWNTAMNGRRDEWKIRTYNPNALSQSKTEAYEQYVKNAGISKKQYEKILSDANLNGGTVSQDEMGSYLTDALKAKDLTKAQATAVWTSLWNSPSSKTYDKWLEGKTKEAAKPKDDAYADYKKNVSIYDKDEAYEGWKNNLQGLGVSLDTFTKTINAANIDGNSSIKQDELGEYLYNQIQNKKMTEEEANAWFLVFWNGQRSKTYSMWAAKNKK